MTPDEIRRIAEPLNCDTFVACRFVNRQSEGVFRFVFVERNGDLALCGTHPEAPCFLVKAERVVSIRPATDEDIEFAE